MQKVNYDSALSKGGGMTTIAVRDGVMAADTQSDHCDKRSPCRKLFRANGAIIGICGCWSDGKVFVDWYAAGADRKKPPDWRVQGDEQVEFEALVVTEDGIDWWSYPLVPERLRDPFWSIGSGSMAAMAAMRCGRNAQEAVSIAMQVDPQTGGEVETMELAK